MLLSVSTSYILCVVLAVKTRGDNSLDTYILGQWWQTYRTHVTCFSFNTQKMLIYEFFLNQSLVFHV